ncbi:MAG: 4Fe-4S ferredoxin-type protein [Chloroflexi bacterium]|nr:4Fe-4S ferredoxin-type protein [Chloroflexota bacterium]
MAAITERPTPGDRLLTEPLTQGEPGKWDGEFAAPPDLGRTVHVVGPVINVKPSDTPHPRNSRGELGPVMMTHRNRLSVDPLSRVIGEVGHALDRRNVPADALNRAPKGDINPVRVQVSDPAAMSRHIKRVAHYLGADVVGIARAHPTMLNNGRISDEGMAEGGAEPEDLDELCRKYPYLIVASTAWDNEMIQAHRHRIGDTAYHGSQQKGNLALRSLEGYIKELGYTALRGTANGQAVALAAGVGELGRNGLIITEKYGARVNMSGTLMTDLPLAPGKPIDLGVEDFCKVCRKCANTCPTNSISFGDKVVYNGIEKYKINWLTCYRLRPFVHKYWEACLTCVAVCPYTKPNTWWRTLAIKALQTTPIPARGLVVRGLKWLDDRFWGAVKQSRVQWMGYDSGIKPGEQACTIAGCTADHEDHGQSGKVAGEVGYYFPLKENTNRFVKRDKV